MLIVWLIWGLIADQIFPNQEWLMRMHPGYGFTEWCDNKPFSAGFLGVEALEVAALLAVAAYRFRKLARRV